MGGFGHGGRRVSRGSRLPLAPWQVWWVQFDPQVGHEQAGHRPAIVVGTALACSLPNGLVLVVPCTTTDRGLPIQPPVNLAGRRGFAMCDQIKSLPVDRLDRPHPAEVAPTAERPAIAQALRALISVTA